MMLPIINNRSTLVASATSRHAGCLLHLLALMLLLLLLKRECCKCSMMPVWLCTQTLHDPSSVSSNCQKGCICLMLPARLSPALMLLLLLW